MKYILSALLFFIFFAANAPAMTLHVLWLTARNETGENDLQLNKAGDPNLELFGEENFDYIPLKEQGHEIKHYRFGQQQFGAGDCPLEKNAVLRFIANLRIASNDAVLVYYRGHGGFDEKDKMNPKAAKQYYTFRNDNGSYDYLPHADIRLAVEKLHPRLAVFIRDCCGSWVKIPPRGVTTDDMAEAKEGSFHYHPRYEQKLFLSLFVKSRGVVDVASSKEGFAAMAVQVNSDDYDTDKLCGTVFSNSFNKVFNNHGRSELTWGQFFNALARECENRFSRMNPNGKDRNLVGKHTPHCYVDGGIYAVPDFAGKLRKSTILSDYFGFEGVPVYAGVLLTRVEKGSRADAYGLEANKEFEGKRISDIIYAVDDVIVTTNEELDLACRIMGDDGQLKFTLVNGRDGSVQNFDFPDIRAEPKW